MMKMPMRILGTMKFSFEVIAFVVFYVGGAFALNTSFSYNITIVGASICGALVLAYFRRDRDYKEIFFKSACAAISGLVLGATLVRYYNFESIEYVIAVYFFASMLSLFLIRGLLAVTEQNATGFIVTVFQRILNTSGSNTLNVTPHDTTPPITPLAGKVLKTDIIIKKDGDIKSEIVDSKIENID
jgi:hypothetical protein